MPQRPLAKKAWQTHNISGLRSRQRDSSVTSRLSGHLTSTRSLAPSPEGDESDLEEDDDDLDLLIHFDSLKTCQALFIFNQSSAHASLPPDTLKAFKMNKSNGGKQRKQQDTIILESNLDACYPGQPQSMTTESREPKGPQSILEEHRYNCSNLKAECSLICPIESKNCCMAQLLSQQDDFMNQTSMVETLITEAGHECLFLPKFHCKLNPIEMVSQLLLTTLNNANSI